MRKQQVALIGAGLQAQRRSPAILQDSRYKIAWVVDIVADKAYELSKECGARYSTDWAPVVQDKNLDAVLVLTYPDSHASIAISAMRSGKDVLCEKPLARTEKEAEAMLATAKKTGRILKCGFNHRHHPAIKKAHELFINGLIGKAIFGRGKYGIMGRQGLEKEWRSNPQIVSGGQLMEQGIHLVDLFRWFLGEIDTATGFVDTAFWPIAPLEDNAFALLKTKNGTIVSLHSSLTQWINTFEFEIYGDKGSLTVQGLGGSYGVEKLIVNLYHPDGPFNYETTEFRGHDISWQSEWEEFTRAIKTRKSPVSGAVDGLRAMEIVRAVYESSKTGCAIKMR